MMKGFIKKECRIGFAQLSHADLVSRLEYLCRKWRKNSKDYELAKRQERKIGGQSALSTAARYEGESIAMRWCAEDLEKLL